MTDPDTHEEPMLRAALRPNLDDTGAKESLVMLNRGHVEVIVDAVGEAVRLQRRDSHVHTVLFRSGAISRPLWCAGEQFRGDFARACLGGHFGSTAPGRLIGSGNGLELTEAMCAARDRVDRALAMLGRGLSGQTAWHCLGCGASLEDLAQRLRWGGRSVNCNKLSGVMLVVLERLAVHYRLLGLGDVRAEAAERARRDVASSIAALAQLQAAAAAPAAAAALRDFAALVQSRYAAPAVE